MGHREAVRGLSSQMSPGGEGCNVAAPERAVCANRAAPLFNHTSEGT